MGGIWHYIDTIAKLQASKCDSTYTCSFNQRTCQTLGLILRPTCPLTNISITPSGPTIPWFSLSVPVPPSQPMYSPFISCHLYIFIFVKHDYIDVQDNRGARIRHISSPICLNYCWMNIGFIAERIHSDPTRLTLRVSTAQLLLFYTCPSHMHVWVDAFWLKMLALDS